MNVLTFELTFFSQYVGKMKTLNSKSKRRQEAVIPVYLQRSIMKIYHLLIEEAVGSYDC